MFSHDSSLVRGVGYDYDTGTLTLRLNSRRYEYDGVPEQVYQHLLACESLGRAYNRVVKGFYPCREVK